jgi:transcription initiation factor TFIID subunit 13
VEIMMYGYGDHPSPLPQTVEVLEDIVIGYLTDLIYKSMDAAALRGKLRQGGQKVGSNALVVDDVLHNVRKDSKKYGRVQELLILQEEIKKAKQIFVDEDAK